VDVFASSQRQRFGRDIREARVPGSPHRGQP
jgi:hypothetical protein